MKASKNKGFCVPYKVTVVRFSDDPTTTELIDSPVSSVQQLGYEMEKEATGVLLNSWKNGQQQGVLKVLKTRSVIRESSDHNEQQESFRKS